MGWLSRFAGYTDHLQVRILMNFDLDTMLGEATVVWEPGVRHPSFTNANTKIVLAGLLYARILCVHKDTRDELFERVGDAALNLTTGQPLTLAPWVLLTHGLACQLWPWCIHPVGSLSKRKEYVATLQSTTKGALIINLKMPFGQEAVLAPSAPLIVLHDLCETLTLTERMYLGAVLIAINAYYGSPESIRFGSETNAVAVAMQDVLQPASSIA